MGSNEANELDKRRNMMLLSESHAMGESELPSLMMLRPAEMPVGNDVVHQSDVRPAPVSMMLQDYGVSYCEDSPVADSPMMDCCTVDLPFNGIMEAADFSGLLDSMDEPIF